MTSVDRIHGLSGQQAIKTPCRLATTAAITLSGEQTIDGVAAVEGDRVLVKDQADTTTNGVYDVSTGAWTRSIDFDGANDILDGTLVLVGSGSTNVDLVFKLNATAPVAIDTTGLTFTVATTFTGISAFGATLLDGADASAARTTLGVRLGTDVQAYNATLAALAAQTEAANKVQYYTADNTPGLLDFSTGASLGTSDTTVSSQKAIKTYVDAAVAAVSGRLVAGTPLAQNPYSTSATATQAHGLSAQPSMFKAELECLTGEHNYTAGDKIQVHASIINDINVATYSGFALLADTTNVVLISSVNALYIPNKTTYAAAQITPANWKLTVTPYKIS